MTKKFSDLVTYVENSDELKEDLDAKESLVKQTIARAEYLLKKDDEKKGASNGHERLLNKRQAHHIRYHLIVVERDFAPAIGYLKDRIVDSTGTCISASLLASAIGDELTACKLRDITFEKSTLSSIVWRPNNKSTNIFAEDYAERKGYFQYALKVHEKCLEHEKSARREGAKKYNGSHEESIKRLRTRLEEIISHPEKARCDEQTDDPLVLLRPFFRNFKALQVDEEIRRTKYPSRTIKARSYKIENKDYHGKLQISFGADDDKERNMGEEYLYDFSFGNSDFSYVSPQDVDRTNLMVILDINRTPIPEDAHQRWLERENEFVDLQKGKRKFKIQTSIKTLKRDVRVQLDYLMQKFFTGSYNPDASILYNPRAASSNKVVDIDPAIQNALGILFSGEEKSELERKITAQLKTRGSWQSVPRLNLGTIQLPTPGMKDVRKDAFVTEAAPYLVEYLTALNVMSIEEAEELAVRKLTHYFVHDAGYQLNRNRAEEVVKTLRSQFENSTKKEVA